MDSPRSLEACRQLGILPEELYFQDFETYIHMNPEVIGLPKEIQKIRFDNIDKYRKAFVTTINNIAKINPPLYLTINSIIIDGKYVFETHSDKSTARVPMGFECEQYIENDIYEIIKELKEY